MEMPFRNIIKCFVIGLCFLFYISDVAQIDLNLAFLNLSISLEEYFYIS